MLGQFTHDVKKIKGVAHKNGDVDGTCKRAFTQSGTGTVTNGVCGITQSSNCTPATMWTLPGVTLLLLLFFLNNSLFTLPDPDSSNTSDPMDTLYCAEDVHIADSDSDPCLNLVPQSILYTFLAPISVPRLGSESVSGNVNKPKTAQVLNCFFSCSLAQWASTKTQQTGCSTFKCESSNFPSCYHI